MHQAENDQHIQTHSSQRRSKPRLLSRPARLLFVRAGKARGPRGAETIDSRVCTYVLLRLWAASLGLEEAGLCGRGLALTNLFCSVVRPRFLQHDLVVAWGSILTLFSFIRESQIGVGQTHCFLKVGTSWSVWSVTLVPFWFTRGRMRSYSSEWAWGWASARAWRQAMTTRVNCILLSLM